MTFLESQLGCLKGQKLTAGFLTKNLMAEIMPQNTPKIGFSRFCKKKKKRSIDVEKFGF